MTDTRIHIVHIIPSLFFGGAERFVVNLVNSSDPKKFRFTIITFFDLNPLAQDLKIGDSKVEIIPKHGVISWSLIQQLKKRLVELQPDVVHTHLFGGDVWGRIAAHDLKIPIVTTEHSFNKREGFFKHFFKWYLKNYSDCYTAPSYALQKFLKEKKKIQRPVAMIHHGILLEQFKFAPTTFTHSPLRLMILGRLVEEKGHAVVLRALAHLLSFSWVLEIVGEGVEGKNLEKLVQDLGISNRVIFSGLSKDVPQKVRESDIVLVPSLEVEGLGMVVLEAMAGGRVVIGSDVGGIAELIEDKKNGFLTKAGSAEEWVKIMEWCFTHTRSLGEMANYAQKYAEEHFSSQRMAQEYEKIYLKLAKK